VASSRERRVRLDLAYDGTEFAGWQEQAGQRTVQEVVSTALARLHGERRTHLRGAGRTDAGVHAARQVADCVIGSRLGDADLAHALRGMLPADVRPLAVRSVAQEFDARRDAVSKTYRYTLDVTPWGDPFGARYALHHPGALDDEALHRALALLRGRRDWTGFTAAGCSIEDRVRDLAEARYDRPGADRACFTFRASGFLRHMVRNLVGTLLEIGRGRMALARIDEILARGDRALGGPTAPAHGLCLVDVAYAEGEDGS
jgi:tRNA pseudouridine38-40 synthase